MEWWIWLVAYLVPAIAIASGTLIAMGLGAGGEYPDVRRGMRRTVLFVWVWPVGLCWLIVRGIRAAWRERGQ